MRYTLASLRTSRIQQMINIAGTDSRFAPIVNEGVERLITRGHWLGTAGRYVLSVNNSSVVTLPASLCSLEKVALDKTPLPIRSGFYEFIESGYGTWDDTTSLSQCIRIAGLYPTSVDITAGSRVKVTCDNAADVSKLVIVLGTDSDGNEIRSTQSGVVEAGEAIALSLAGTTSVYTYNSITGIIAPSDLSYGWWLYQVNGGVSTLLSAYRAWETHPGYTRYRIGGLSLNTQTVEGVGRAAYVPMKSENDFCIISNYPALKLACAAVVAGEAHMHEKETALMALATRELDLQVSHTSEAELPAFEVVGSDSYGGCDPVDQLY